MIKQELLRGKVVQVNMYNLNRTINSKAVFNQKDVKTAVLLCQLSMDGSLDLTDCSVTAEILKPDGTTIIQKAQVMNATEGLVTVGLTEQCLSAIGEVLCELVIQTDNQILYSPKITYTVVDNLFDTENIESTDEFPILNILISEVQAVQKELDVLETTITTNEGIRQEKESERVIAEEQRIAAMDQIQETADSKIQEMNGAITEATKKLSEKVLEIDLEIERSKTSTVTQVGRVDAKIIEIDNRIAAINSTLEFALNAIETEKNELSQKVTDKILEVDNKLIQATETLQRITLDFEDKLKNVDLELSKKLSATDELVANKLNELSNQASITETTLTQKVDNKIAGYDAKVQEVNNKIADIDNTKNTLVNNVNSKMSEVNNTQTTLTQKVDEKISGYDSKVSEVDLLVTNVTSAESSRVQAETNRTNIFNTLIKELEVTQTDIDDILNMVGGL